MKLRNYLPAIGAASLLSTVFTTSVFAANNTAEAVARVGQDIKYLASDELEGRGPATPGLQKAAEYIRDEFKRLGLKSGVEDGSFMQPFDLSMGARVLKAETKLVLHGPDGKKIELELDKNFTALANGGNGDVKAEIVFAGYGVTAPKLNYDDYKDLDVEGKVLLIIRREPQQGDEKSAFDGKKVTSHSYVRTKLALAKKLKAAAILMVNDPYSTKQKKEDKLTPASGFGGGRPAGVPFAHIQQEIANQLLATSPLQSAADDEKLSNIADIERSIDKALKPVSQPLQGWTAELSTKFEKGTVKVANVVGVLEGEGPLAHETIVVGAHYDHLGYGPYGSRRPASREIHNGANDNATGTACLMELARRLAGADKKPARRIVFIGFSAEERGIIGARYYADKPLFPLKDTIAMFNFDMVGALKAAGLTIGGVKSSPEFTAVVDAASKATEMKINPTGPVGASDHSAFYGKSIPVMFFFTGLTKEYHTPEDDFELVNVAGVVKTIDFSEHVIDSVSNMSTRPKFTKVSGRSRTRGGMAYLGIVPDYSGGDAGILITGVNADSPAAKGGLTKGDIITKIGDVDIGDIESLTKGLRKYKPGNKVVIIVKREKAEKKLDVTLGKPREQDRANKPPEFDRKIAGTEINRAESADPRW